MGAGVAPLEVQVYGPRIQIRAMRDYMGLTQREFAERLSKATDRERSYAQTNVHEWEADIRRISDRAAKACLSVAFERWEADRRAALRSGGSAALVDRHWVELLGDPILGVLLSRSEDYQAAKAAADPSQAQLALIAMAGGLADILADQVGRRPPLA